MTTHNRLYALANKHNEQKTFLSNDASRMLQTSVERLINSDNRSEIVDAINFVAAIGDDSAMAIAEQYVTLFTVKFGYQDNS